MSRQGAGTSVPAPLACPARRLVVRPGPGLLYVAQLWLSIINFACNSPAACSNIEFASLELQRFLGSLKFGPIELHAKFVWLGSCRRLSNFARNSPATCLDIEVVSLALQRFRRVSKSDRGELCAKFVWTRPRASNPVPALWILRRTSHLWCLVCCCVSSHDHLRHRTERYTPTPHAGAPGAVAPGAPGNK